MRGKTRSTKAAIEEAVSRVVDGGEKLEHVAATSAVHVLTIKKYMAARGADPSAAGGPAAGGLAAGGAAAGGVVGGARRGRKPALDPLAEQELLEHVLQLSAQGAEITTEHVLQLANDKVLQVYGESAARPTLSFSWLRRFKERHPTLPLDYSAASPELANCMKLPQESAGSDAGSDARSKRGRKPILDPQAELDIMNALQQLVAQGQRVTSDTILQMARDKVREVSGGASAPVLSMSWLQRFKERHPTLFSDRVRQKRSREEEELDLATAAGAVAGTAIGAGTGVKVAEVKVAMSTPDARNVRPRTSDAFQSPLAAAAALTSSTSAPKNGHAASAPLATDELLRSLLRMSEKIVTMQSRQLEVLVQLVDAVKEKHV